MKRILPYLICCLMLCSANLTFAQDSFSKFEKNKNINNVVVNKKMFEMMANVKVEATNTEEKLYFDLIKKLTSLRVFNTKTQEVKKEMTTTINEYVQAKNLKELVNKKDSDSKVVIYIDKTGTNQNISELVMFNDSVDPTKETVLVHITGNFSLKELSSLTKKMNLPLGNTLDKL
ncbi:DUF4252 domain-containing protein [Myroides sp. 1354]|uniref:DUF4252 domain-containing protein n=1 Tax=unclassified Myroides TaxID=2642485 RepID=UPI0025757925|nr:MULTISPECIES: DUF4252 domain-containing protein [unclassified Myroides]MDM1045426.1 DUF4252 domain-containing protein [Myroides sp. R163-1]MDM1056337.1 DUF4252 domain-containing protein [Myroides sp. 1354]MDM1069557.1 DUF4252 domain-containing protein [Myroides sp. 1372]